MQPRAACNCCKYCGCTSEVPFVLEKLSVSGSLSVGGTGGRDGRGQRLGSALESALK